MLSIIAISLFVVIFVGVLKLTLRIAWGIAKVLAFVLLIAALPFLLWCVLCASGVILFAPLILLGVAFAVLCFL